MQKGPEVLLLALLDPLEAALAGTVGCLPPVAITVMSAPARLPVVLGTKGMGNRWTGSGCELEPRPATTSKLHEQATAHPKALQNG